MTTACVEIKAAINSSGYSSCYYLGKKMGAHVRAYLQSVNGDLDHIKGKVVMHTCDNRLCVNPAHLVLGTQSENIKDMVAKGRQRLTVRYGEHATHKLKDSDVDYIRKHYVRGINQTQRGNAVELAERFGVSRNLIQKIAQGAIRVRGTITTTTGAVPTSSIR